MNLDRVIQVALQAKRMGETGPLSTGEALTAALVLMRMVLVDEAKIAMGFPERYLLPSNKKDGMQMMGNAVCPPKACQFIQALRAAA